MTDKELALLCRTPDGALRAVREKLEAAGTDTRLVHLNDEVAGLKSLANQAQHGLDLAENPEGLAAILVNAAASAIRLAICMGEATARIMHLNERRHA